MQQYSHEILSITFFAAVDFGEATNFHELPNLAKFTLNPTSELLPFNQ